MTCTCNKCYTGWASYINNKSGDFFITCRKCSGPPFYEPINAPQKQMYTMTNACATPVKQESYLYETCKPFVPKRYIKGFWPYEKM